MKMDHNYAREKLQVLMRDLPHYTGEEFWRQMSRIAGGATGTDHAEEMLTERDALVEKLGKAERLAEYESESFRILCHAIQRLEEIVGIDTGGFNGPGPAIGEVERIVKERDALAGDLDRLRKAAFEVCNDWCNTHESVSRPVFDAMLESTGNRTPDGKPIDWLAEAALGLKPKEPTE